MIIYIRIHTYWAYRFIVFPVSALVLHLLLLFIPLPCFPISVVRFINVLFNFGLGGQFNELYASLAAFWMFTMLYYHVLCFFDKYACKLVMMMTMPSTLATDSNQQQSALNWAPVSSCHLLRCQYPHDCKSRRCQALNMMAQKRDTIDTIVLYVTSPKSWNIWKILSPTDPSVNIKLPLNITLNMLLH